MGTGIGVGNEVIVNESGMDVIVGAVGDPLLGNPKNSKHINTKVIGTEISWVYRLNKGFVLFHITQTSTETKPHPPSIISKYKTN